ncbi:MAG: Fe-S-binding domain-containing protein, partial [Acidobacteria bacterium]
MPTLKINGIEVEVERGTTVLEAARFLGIPIPTLCHED